MMTHYTHMCMNCGPERPTGVAGAPTTMIDGRCERCGSEAIAPIALGRSAADDDSARLAALEIFHTEIVREKDRLVVLLKLRERELLAALAAYRALHPACKVYTPGDELEARRRRGRAIDRRCKPCKRADALRGMMDEGAVAE
jgi:hypothetical protein